MGFIWYELMTTELEPALAFYRELVGWSASDHPSSEASGSRYAVLSAGDRGVGGAMQLTDGMRAGGARPAWVGYVGVADTDAEAREVEQAGGRILMPPGDIPGVGRFALVADPGGAPFYLLTPHPMPDAPPPAPRMTQDHCGWHELYAADGETAWRFYSERFGWSEVSTLDMGPMGTYRLWSAAPDGEAVGGMMTRPPQMPQPAWLFYFVVASVDSAAEQIGANGGQVINGPMQVPDGSWIVQGLDPQGAMFALVSETR
jgi:hypothetical protein